MPLRSRRSPAARKARTRRSVCAVLVAAGVAYAPLAHAIPSALPNYPAESDFLAHVPGSSSSLAAGFFNPAAWGTQQRGALIAWDDSLRGAGPRARSTVWKFPGLGFGTRRLELRPGDGTFTTLTDYTLALSGGTQAGGFGIGYSWASNQKDTLRARWPRHERLAVGAIVRPSRMVSIGSVYTHDLDASDNTWQADIGVRPFGTRVTLFADAVTRKGERLGDAHTGFGAEVIPLRGLTLSGKVRDDDSFSFAATVTLSRGLRVSARPHYDANSDHTGNTYTVEVGPAGPPIYEPRRRGIREVDLRGSLAYQRYQLFDDRRTLLSVLEEIARAAGDPSVGGLALNLSGMQMTPEMLWEVRTQLARFRETGRTVTVYADNLNMFTYVFATVANTIWLDPMAEVDVRGLAAGRTFYKSALDKLGIGVDELRFFTYKSAVESFSRTSMSDADRQQRQDLIDDWYEDMARTVTRARGFTRAEWDTLVNTKAYVLAEEARTLRLADSIGSWHDALAAARRDARRVRATSPIALVHGDHTWDELEWGMQPRIAVLYAIGPCEMDSGIRGRVLSRKIREARDNRAVKAIVLRADSPGGDPLPSDLVARELRLASKVKPVIVSQGQVAGSGGYWISMDGDAILSSPYSITGSIGVISMFIYDKSFTSRMGLSYDGVARGRHADLERGASVPFIGAVIPRRDLSPEERERARQTMFTLYDNFVDAVARARDLPRARVDSIGQGHFYSGSRAQGLGLVDDMGTLWDALALAKQRSGIPATRAVDVTEGPSVGFINPDLFKISPFGTRAALVPSAADLDPVRAVLDALPSAERAFFAHMARAGMQPRVMFAPVAINGVELW